jgi:UDP-N-acetylmuramyl pentapeptide phosphotransferase/UDP-N-acetylglucosamine-1-phosphate transferase
MEVPEMQTWPLIAALAGLLVGFAVGRWAAPQLLEALAATNLSRVNYRQRTVVAGLGAALVVGLLVWAGPLALVGELASGSGWPARSGVAMSGVAVAVVLAGLAFALLGLLDDLIQDQGSRGFRGHLRALWSGRLTGGALKLIGGALVALVVAPLAVGLERPWYLALVGAVVIASSANLANLLDLRPGRCTKVFLPLWVVGCLLDPNAGAWSAGLAGAAAGTFPLDLGERGMLGDAGANALGAVVGVLLISGPAWLLWSLAVVLLGLQAASERVSFSRVIDGNRWLRAVDRLGRENLDA